MTNILIAIFTLTVSIPVGSVAIAAMWTVPDKIVHDSGDQRLQSMYEPSKQMIDAAITVNDWRETAKSWLTLIGLVGGGGLGIWVILKTDFNF